MSQEIEKQKTLFDEISFGAFDGKPDEDILASLSRNLGVTKDELLSHSRKQNLVYARDLAVYILREYGDLSYPAIGKMLGGRDHTTIIHAYRKIKGKGDNEIISGDRGFSELINKVKSFKENKEYIVTTLIPNIIKSVKESQGHALIKPKEIPERSLKILELYREGLTFSSIGNIFKLTRERVRQVVKSTIFQIAINDSFAKGIELDGDVLLEEEKKKRSLLKNNQQVVKKPKEKRWSKYYISCKKCNLTSYPHVRFGLCEKCIGQYRGDRRENIIIQHNNKCDHCNLIRSESFKKYGRDFYITKDQKVFCKDCFLLNTGKTLGGYRNFEWSRHYPECLSCGTKTVPYAGHGLCRKCANTMTRDERDIFIKEQGNSCSVCGIDRKKANEVFGHDLFITKEKKILCMKCHLKSNRSKKV